MDGRNTSRWDPVEDYDQRYRDEEHEALYAESGFSNFGYWEEGTEGVVDACRNLVDKLVEMLPAKRGTILDVACGSGGTTKQLTKHFAPPDITAINISGYQVERTQAQVPEAKCLQMSATNLEFEPGSFENVICVEAAYNFRTRLRFFKEAYRVLKSGGGLVLSDILVAPPESAKYRVTDELLEERETPLVNRVNAATYRDMLEVLGFRNVKLVTALQKTWKSLSAYVLAHQVQQFCKLGDEATAKDKISLGTAMRGRDMGAWDKSIRDYILVSAEK